MRNPSLFQMLCTLNSHFQPLARLLRNQRDEISSNVAFTAITRGQNPQRSLTYADWAPVGSYCLGLRALHVLTHPELPLIPFGPERGPLPVMKATLTGPVSPIEVNPTPFSEHLTN